MNLNATLIVQTIVFLILGWITMKFIWPPLTAALAERQKCLTKLAAAGDIPAEVLMSLPSPEEIARRAEEAKAKAAAALAAQKTP